MPDTGQLPVALTGADAPAADASAARPDHIPEKFWNEATGTADTEAWAKSYGELETKLSDNTATDAAETDDTAADEAAGVDEADDVTSDDDAAEALDAVGLDLAKYDAEYQKDGKLSEDTYTELASKGFDGSAVDAYIRGREAQRDEVLSEVGGPEAFANMREWANTALTEDELTSFDSALASAQDANHQRLLLAGMAARFEAENGKPPHLVQAKTGGGVATGDGYQSVAQMTTDMQNPLYKTDPAFRAEVERKLAKAAWHKQ